MTNKEILSKLESVALFLSAHPDNEYDSEMNDRLNDIFNVVDFLKLKNLTPAGVKQRFSGFKDINGSDIYFDSYVYLINPDGSCKNEIFSVRNNFQLLCIETGRSLIMHDLHAKGYEFILTTP